MLTLVWQGCSTSPCVNWDGTWEAPPNPSRVAPNGGEVWANSAKESGDLDGVGKLILARASPAKGDAEPNPKHGVEEALPVEGEAWLLPDEDRPIPASGVPISTGAACLQIQGSSPGAALGVSPDGLASAVTHLGEGIISTDDAPPGVLAIGEVTIGDAAIPSGDRGVMAPEASKLNWLGCKP